MSTEDRVGFANLGEQIGARLASAKTSPAQPAIAARLLIDGVLKAHASVKLPELLADNDIKDWLTAHRVSEGQLRTALSKARQDRRKVPVTREPSVSARTPRKKSSGPPVAVTEVAKAPVTPAIPNRPLDEL